MDQEPHAELCSVTRHISHQSPQWSASFPVCGQLFMLSAASNKMEVEWKRRPNYSGHGECMCSTDDMVPIESPPLLYDHSYSKWKYARQKQRVRRHILVGFRLSRGALTLLGCTNIYVRNHVRSVEFFIFMRWILGQDTSCVQENSHKAAVRTRKCVCCEYCQAHFCIFM